MHNVLARQLRRLGISLDEPPTDVATWKDFLERVEGYYEDADRSRYLLERSLRVSSDELNEANRSLMAMSAAKIERSEAHYRDLFRLSRVPTWEENFEAAVPIMEGLRADGVTDLESYLLDHPEMLTKLVTSVEITAVNPAVTYLVRSTDPTALIGPMDPMLVSEQNTPAWIAQFETIWNGLGWVRIDDLVGDRMDGEEFHGILEWHAPLVGDSFDYSRVVVTIIDITDRIVAEQQMQAVLKSKDEFLASISHELRTPLTSVLGFAEVLRSMGDTSPEERDSLLAIIASQASDLSDIVEDLLVAARAELGQLSVVSVPIDVHAQIAQVVEGRSDSDKRVKAPDRPPDKLPAIGDPQRVRQILRNLITNAERYGGGEVFLEVEETDRYIHVRVVDDGPGLSDELRERVFERYYRVHADGGQPGSVGIGLTISRELAQMMGGDLFYEHRDGLSVFTLKLCKPAK